MRTYLTIEQDQAKYRYDQDSTIHGYNEILSSLRYQGLIADPQPNQPDVYFKWRDQWLENEYAYTRHLKFQYIQEEHPIIIKLIEDGLLQVA
jgi:hypothetical protein